MTSLGQLVANSLWYAFDALDQQKSGTVPKSQLKVLTQNVGVLLNINRRVEECITDYLSVVQLSFEQFLYFLTYEVLAEVDNGSQSYTQLKRYHDDLEKAFWVLGRPALPTRHQPILSDESLYKIFRVFCLLADWVSHKGALTQVSLARGEMEEVTRCLVTELGREFDPQDFNQLAMMIPVFTLPVFITFLEGRYLQDMEGPAVEAAVEEIYQVFVEQVLEKGKIYQRIPFAPVWIAREIELFPWEIRSCRTLPNIRIPPVPSILQPIKVKFISGPLATLSKKTTVHRIPDVPGVRPCRFTVCSDGNKPLPLAAPDHRTKTRWLRSLDEAIAHSEEPLPYQRILSGLRKEGRAQEEERQIQEIIRRASQADIIEQTQAELIAERMARVEAEEAAREEAAGRAEEEKRVKELTMLRQQLEELLAQETQAKRDEEIVRNLQARVLREEWEKREELELLQKEQKALLEEEKKKREAFEKIQHEKEAQLQEAQRKLRKLETERMKFDHELRSTREKIVKSGRGKEILEARLKVKERVPPARTFSLRPVRREQRAVPLRSSSFSNHTANKKIIPKSQTPEGGAILPLQKEEQHSEEDELSDIKEISDSLINHPYRVTSPASHLASSASDVASPASHVASPASHVESSASHVTPPASQAASPASQATSYSDVSSVREADYSYKKLSKDGGSEAERDGSEDRSEGNGSSEDKYEIKKERSTKPEQIEDDDISEVNPSDCGNSRSEVDKYGNRSELATNGSDVKSDHDVIQS